MELVIVDICLEVSLISYHLALPREGHLNKLFKIFAYLKCKHRARMVFDTTYPSIYNGYFPRHDWWKHYGEVKEVIPKNVPSPRGKGFDIIGYFDADLAGDKVIRRSRTGFVIYLNQAPIYWFSNRQKGVECSTFGSEFIAMKKLYEYVRGLLYKIRMMGILVIGCSFLYGDNQSVLCNTCIPYSNLKKKNHAFSYHFV